MSDYTDLIARLRDLMLIDEVGSNNTFGQQCSDAIEAQQREIERLKADVVTYMQIANETVAERDALLDLVHWSYGKLSILVFSKMDDALKLDEMKLLLMQESSDE